MGCVAKRCLISEPRTCSGLNFQLGRGTKLREPGSTKTMTFKSHVTINRDHWNGMADDWVATGERLWSCAAPEWGIWGHSEADLRLLPPTMQGLSAIELGCGTGYVSGWMARLGARVMGVDVSARQLETARRLALKFGADITFVEGNAESVEVADSSFDFAISEYGAAIWCDPDIWLREAWRLLKPDGHLVFMGDHPLVAICNNETGEQCDFQLHRPYRNLMHVDWANLEIDPGGVEFNRSFEGWLSLFRDIGFVVLDYQELYAPGSATGTRFSISAEWAKLYPAEQVWKVKKVA